MGIIRNEAEFQDNASRIGFHLGTKTDKASFFIHAELSINFIKSTFSFNADAQTSSGFLVFDRDQEGQVFGNRLSYIGIDLHKYGKISVGKQWGTYYDVSGYTDQFNVFGGRGSNTYVAGTDGGIGTGRSNQALIYRNSIGRFTLGTQMLLRSTTNNRFIDGYGASLQYSPFIGFRIGASFTTALFADPIINNTIGFDDDPKYFIAGIQYLGDTFEAGLVYAVQTNGDLADTIIDEEETVTVVYDNYGTEFYFKYKQRKFRVLGGINYAQPDTQNLPLHPDFKTLHFIAGMEYRPFQLSYFYTEYRHARGYDQFGISNPDLFTLGIRIDISHRAKKNINFQ
nr:porin [Robertkochia sp. 3YJGBD-33]